MTIEALSQSMTPAEVAVRLGINRRTVMLYIHAGELAATNVGGRSVPKFRITEEAVERFLAARTTPAPQSAVAEK